MEGLLTTTQVSGCSEWLKGWMQVGSICREELFSYRFEIYDGNDLVEEKTQAPSIVVRN